MTPLDQLLFLLKAVPVTLAISLLSFILGFSIGIPLSFLRIYGKWGLKAFADGYEKVFRAVPVIAIMFLLRFGVGGIVPIFKDAFFTAVISLGMVSGANQSQIFRSTIGAVGRSQMMAAISVGFSTFGAVRYVILPQAFMLALPGLGSEIALLIKDSAYSFFIGVVELMEHAEILRASQRSPVLPYIASALLYIVLTFPLANYLDRWGSRKKRELGL